MRAVQLQRAPGSVQGRIIYGCKRTERTIGAVEEFWRSDGTEYAGAVRYFVVHVVVKQFTHG